MNRQVLTLICTFSSAVAFAQNVGIGNTSFTPNTDALLELRSTTSGFLLPKMTAAQMNAISGPTEGLIVYQTNGTAGFRYYDGSAWLPFGAGAADNFGTHIAEANIQLDDFWLTNDGGSEGIRITDNGNVGIGVSDPSERLEVNGKILVNQDVYDESGEIRLSGEDDVYITMDYNNDDSDTRSIRFGKNSMTSPTELMRINENGNVGIGTTSPDRLLNIGASSGAQMLLTREDNSTQSGDVLGEIIFDSTDDTGPSSNDGSAVIRVTASENQGNSNKGGELSFLTKHSGTLGTNSAQERMRITHDGRIGIGTNSPLTKMHLYGNGTSGFSLGGTTAVPNPAEGPEIGFARGGFYNGPAAAIQLIDYDSYSGGLAFLVKRGVANGAGGTFADNFPSDVVQALTIVNTGWVGIGTSNPQAKLHVNGDARISDLAGSGTRMVVADANGGLSTQAIPSGGSSLWTQSGSNVYRSSGKVGIGTSSPSTSLHVSGDARISDLAGSGTRMVVASSNGTLSTQSIPSGGGGGFGSGTTLNLNVTSDISNQDVSGVSIIRLDADNSSHEIKGFTGGVAGQVICIVNTDSNHKVKFKKDQGSQRMREDLEVEKKEGAIIIYDGSYWYLLSKD